MQAMGSGELQASYGFRQATGELWVQARHKRAMARQANITQTYEYSTTSEHNSNSSREEEEKEEEDEEEEE